MQITPYRQNEYSMKLNPVSGGWGGGSPIWLVKSSSNGEHAAIEALLNNYGLHVLNYRCPLEDI